MRLQETMMNRNTGQKERRQWWRCGCEPSKARQNWNRRYSKRWQKRRRKQSQKSWMGGGVTGIGAWLAQPDGGKRSASGKPVASQWCTGEETEDKQVGWNNRLENKWNNEGDEQNTTLSLAGWNVLYLENNYIVLHFVPFLDLLLPPDSLLKGEVDDSSPSLFFVALHGRGIFFIIIAQNTGF